MPGKRVELRKIADYERQVMSSSVRLRGGDRFMDLCGKGGGYPPFIVLT